MIDPTVELLQAMAECGLHPKQIIWDGQWHRFPGIDQTRGDNGRYKAFADQRGAIFMDMRTKEQWRWPGDNPLWREKLKHLEPLSAEEVAKRKKAAAEQRAKDAEIHTKRILNLWERAKPLEDRGHPYLAAKGITGNIPLLKSIIDPETEQEMLLIPMRDRHGSIRNLQRIWPDGTRKQMKQATGSSGLYETIGAARYYINTKTLYICEGWATGWSISQASGCAVIVAFFDGGLLTVGQIIRKKYPDAKLIIAADNDRWKPVKREARMVNPGVWAARRAAKELNAAYVVPDFPDLSTEPTDYDDLRRLTNLAVVREWLDPAKASKAVTTLPPEPDAEPEEPESEPEKSEEGEGDWTDSFPSRFLGGLDDVHYFIPEDYGQILAFSASRLGDKNLGMLAPDEWYEDHFGRRTRNGVSIEWSTAARAIIRESMATGTYQPGKVRGRGAWENKDHKPLLHLGDRLLPPDGKRYIRPETYDGDGRIYPQLPRLEGPAKEILPVKTSRWVLDLFESLLWEHPATGLLVAGWTALAPFCGWLGWRPHIWITGPAGCGKSTIIRDIIRPLLAKMVSYNEGGTTEAGIRQTLGSDALPVLIDEMGKDTPDTRTRVHRILRLMRSASSSGDGAAIVKGTQHGKALRYHARSMFCLGSVGGALKDPQDQQRVLLAHLRDPRMLGEGRQPHWHDVQGRINRISPRLCHMLLARSVKWLRSGRLTELLAITKTAAGIVLDSQRAGDQFGTLLAGTFMLKEGMEDKLPDQDEVVAYAKDIDLGHYMEEAEPEGHDILDLLFQVQETVPTSQGNFKTSIGEMIALVIKSPRELEPPKGVMQFAEAKRFLKDIGFIVGSDCLYVANKSIWISRQLRDTSYTDSHASLLRLLPGASAAPKPKWFAGRQSRATRIPLSVIPIEDRTPAMTNDHESGSIFPIQRRGKHGNERVSAGG
ncbi:MAG: toprim domain-containing protein [Gemmatimonadetes bacterium]|nr:toprim domain-containing protein [Gemmatimonadota bacterium]